MLCHFFVSSVSCTRWYLLYQLQALTTDLQSSSVSPKPDVTKTHLSCTCGTGFGCFVCSVHCSVDLAASSEGQGELEQGIALCLCPGITLNHSGVYFWGDGSGKFQEPSVRKLVKIWKVWFLPLLQVYWDQLRTAGAINSIGSICCCC